MSDITKKIFSIEPDIDDVIEPIETSKMRPKAAPKSDIDPLPEFITRQQTTARFTDDAEASPTAWIMWTGLLLTLVWIAATCIYIFAVSDLGAKWSALPPMALTGLIMAIILPSILITLLWMTWRRLEQMKHDAVKIAAVAKALTRADDSALQSTQTLAEGIRAELAKLDAHLEKTLDRYSTLQVQLMSDTRSIGEVGETLANRADDVGRNLTLQRQALESVSGTFDTKMEALTASITSHGQALTKAADNAAGNISVANETLAQTADNLKQSTDGVAGNLTTVAETIKSSETQFSDINNKLAEMTALLQEEQTKLQTEMNIQVKEIDSAASSAIESSEALMSSLRAGQDTVAALNTASINTNEAIKLQFGELSDRIATAQSETNDIAEKATARVHDSLAETRRDLSKLETEMLALQSKLRNASQKSQELDLDEPEQPLPGIGRLKLKPLETDFPPVEPPQSDLKSALPDEPLNLGEDMYIETLDDEIINYNPDVPRRLAPETKGFGRAKNKKKDKGAWHWRDMLGGLDSLDSAKGSALDIVGSVTPPPMQAAPLAMPVNGADIIDELSHAKLAPSAIVDNGTIIEASNAYMQRGIAAMQQTVEGRIGSPVTHLRQELSGNPHMQAKFKAFTDQYAQQLAQNADNASTLRTNLGSEVGRAFLLCAAALR